MKKPCAPCNRLAHRNGWWGRFDGYWELKIQPHDIAAGMLIVREAGGVATDFAGNADTPTLFAQRQMVASNGLLHPDMLRVLKG